MMKIFINFASKNYSTILMHINLMHFQILSTDLRTVNAEVRQTLKFWPVIQNTILLKKEK